MEDRVPRLRVGPYLFLRQMERARFADRWLAVHEQEDSAHVVYRFPLPPGAAEQQQVATILERATHLNHPHILPIEQVSLGSVGGGNAWVVTPFTGTHDGVLTLAGLLSAKGGWMPMAESERVVIHLLGASRFANVLGFRHGEIDMGEVLVDRRGSLAIELYSLGRSLGFAGPVGGAGGEVVRDEVRSIVAIAYQLITGLPADEPRISAERLVRRLDHRWEEWFDAGLDPTGGFNDADTAISALPSTLRDAAAEVKLSPVQTVLTRLGRALRAR